MFTRPTPPVAAVPPEFAEVPDPAATPAKRPRAWSLSNWSVRWKVVAIVLVPLLLATVFGALRIEGAMTNSAGLRLAAARTDVLPVITKYMSALDVALLASSGGGDVEGAKKNFEARKYELQTRVADTDVMPDVRSGVNTLLSGGQALLDKVLDNSIGVRERVTTYAPILLTAEDVINASVRGDNEQIRAEAQGVSRAIGARGQMVMQEILVTRGADLPEPQLRTSMMALAGTEPSTLFGMSQVLGVSSPEAKTLQQQMVTRMALMSDPDSVLVDNADLVRSIRTTDGIAEQVIKDATAALTKSVHSQATDRRNAAILDTSLVLAAIVIALAIVLLVARAVVRPLRALRDGALKVAHTDLEDEIARIKDGGAEPTPQPLPVYTTEEIGQVAHAVDELHTKALLLAGDEARLRLLVNDMFETMSRRNRSLVDQQLSLIDRLERNEEDPDRLESLFRLDHLAARLRRNSANLLVLAGAQLARDQREPVPLSTVVSAAVSEVEDYRRVETGGLPDCMVVGAAAGGVIHLFAELIDNALRYSPPATSVRISSARGGDGGVLLRIADAGLGMNDADQRMANMRLHAGGDVTPDNARHMGLFVVGRIAARHGIRVGLRGRTASEAGSGTTAEIYLPPTVLEGLAGGPALVRAAGPRGREEVGSSPTAQLASALPVPDTAVAEQAAGQHATVHEPANRNGSSAGAGEAPGLPITLLPRRNPGSSGITEVPAQPPEEHPQRQRRELPTPWWKDRDAQEPNQAPAQAPVQAVSDTSAFFAARSRSAGAQAGTPTPITESAGPASSTPLQSIPPVQPVPSVPPVPSAPAAPIGANDPSDDDVIYRRMISEMVNDPLALANSHDLDWQSVWDRGWSLAAEAEDKPVESHTADHGLPVRTPGARLVPGAATGDDQDDERPLVVVNGGAHAEREPQQLGALRDPEAVRASFTSHFRGVHSGRSHARETLDNGEGPDQR
jgi:signal transduction histidine kinase